MVYFEDLLKENVVYKNNQKDREDIYSHIKDRDQYYIDLLARSIMILEEVLKDERQDKSEAILILDMIIKTHLEFIEEAKVGDNDSLKQFVETHKELDILNSLQKK